MVFLESSWNFTPENALGAKHLQLLLFLGQPTRDKDWFLGLTLLCLLTRFKNSRSKKTGQLLSQQTLTESAADKFSFETTLTYLYLRLLYILSYHTYLSGTKTLIILNYVLSQGLSLSWKFVNICTSRKKEREFLNRVSKHSRVRPRNQSLSLGVP